MIEIIFEDQDLLLINKPAGMVVNRAATIKEQTIQDWMIDRVASASDGKLNRKDWQSLVPDEFSAEFGSPEEIFEQRNGIVHRLDRETSGVLVLAKNPGALVNLLFQFKNRQVVKKYRCLVHGKLTPDHGNIIAPIGRLARNRKQFGVVDSGREAETQYQVEKYYPQLNFVAIGSDSGSDFDSKSLTAFQKQAARIYQGFSLATCWPKTGRTHQIRVHMKHLQHALVGDDVYVGKKRHKLDKIWCARHFLHASSIEFKHPSSQQPVSFEAPLASDLVEVLEKLNDSAI